MARSLYDRIGRGYAGERRTDPRIAAPILAALKGCRSVVNVGAGTGSYEPDDCFVVAVEPSLEMISQRAPNSAPVVRGIAETLPFRNGTFDAAMAVLTVHHWSDRRAGLDEMRRVSGKQVILTSDIDVFADDFWLTRDYVPEIIELDRGRFPSLETQAAEAHAVSVETVLVPSDCVDGFAGAYWSRPEAFLSDDVRASMSGFAVLEESVIAAAIGRLRADLDAGRWDERYGHLRNEPYIDLGYRLLVS